MSNLFNYLFTTHFVDDRRNHKYDEEEFNYYIDKIVNELCGERYGATYSNAYWDDIMCSGYEHSVKYILYDNKPLNKTIYIDKKENYFMFRDIPHTFQDADSPDITINEIKKGNVSYSYMNNKYGVNFAYTYDNKEMHINLDTDQTYNVTIYHTEEPEYEVTINTCTNGYKLNVFPHITLV